MDKLPVFYGYQTESVRDFIEDLHSYFQVKAIPTNNTRKIDILEAQLRGPAKVAYTTSLANVGDAAELGGILAAIPNLGAGPNHPARYTATTEWLR